jgi:hypothetical protein
MKARTTLTYVPALPGTTAERCSCTSHLRNGTLAPILIPQVMHRVASDIPTIRPI